MTRRKCGDGGSSRILRCTLPRGHKGYHADVRPTGTISWEGRGHRVSALRYHAARRVLAAQCFADRLWYWLRRRQP